MKSTPTFRNSESSRKATPFFSNNSHKESPFFSSNPQQEPSFFGKTLQAKNKNISTSESSDSITEANQLTKNETGMPTALKSGLENLSGIDLSGVRVHRNSSKPNAIQAHAFTQGQDIHLAPGQEEHLPHEGWHVVQQMQGRVEPTTQVKGVSINDDVGLEREADVMGEKALTAKNINQKKLETQKTNDVKLIEGHSRQNTLRDFNQNNATGFPKSALIQRIPIAPAVAAAIKALTFAEAITAIGTVVSSAASIIGLVGAAQNDKTGVSPDATLSPTSGDYLMSDVDRDGLAQVFRILYFREVEALVEKELNRGTVLDDAKQEELKQTATSNVKFKLTRSMARRLTTTTEAFVQQGDGGTLKETPWGEVSISVNGGVFPASSSGNRIFTEIAERHQVTMPERSLAYIKRVDLSFESEKDWNFTWNDDIWVRATKLSHTQTQNQNIGIEAEVAFDWDGDTSRYEWDQRETPRIITYDHIPFPAWRGPSDPDD